MNATQRIDCSLQVVVVFSYRTILKTCYQIKILFIIITIGNTPSQFNNNKKKDQERWDILSQYTNMIKRRKELLKEKQYKLDN